MSAEDRSPSEVATEILSKSPYRPIRSLTCSFDEGVLTIAGCLPSYYLKQVTLTAVQNINDVSKIEDRVEVTME